MLIRGDVPPPQSALKRQLLFFDSLLVPAPDDAALLNKNEVAEVFPDGYALHWGELGPYPRSVSYDDAFRLLRSGAEPATRSGKLQFVRVGARSPMEATQNWVAAVAALKTELLVRAALPDHAPDAPAPNLNSNAGYNMVVPSRTGYESKFHWLTQVDTQAALPLDELWRRVAMGRLGRAMKVVRRAAADGAIPLAVDPTNQNICLALGAQAYGDPTREGTADLSTPMPLGTVPAGGGAVSTPRLLVFISYRIDPDEKVASAFKRLLESAIEPPPEVFVSGAGGLRPSRIGYKPQLQEAVRKASAFVGLITQASKEREWIFYEAGAA